MRGKPLVTLAILLEARVGIGRFSPQLRVKNAHFSEQINLNRLNPTILVLTILVSVLVSASVAWDAQNALTVMLLPRRVSTATSPSSGLRAEVVCTRKSLFLGRLN